MTIADKDRALLALLFVVTAVSVGLSCYSPYQYFECSETGIWAAVETFALAVAANQGVYLATKHLGGAAIEPA